MTKVFIGGSMKISHLDDEMKKRIDRIIENRYPVLIGDANGADKAVQQYLKSRQYDLVEIFCIEGYCRNNVGNWPVRIIPAPNGKNDFRYYEAKDKVMADEASVGFMIWDGKSLGTLMNVFRLISQQKKVVIYVAHKKEFSNLRNITDWENLLINSESDIRRRINMRTAMSEKIPQSSAQVGLF